MRTPAWSVAAGTYSAVQAWKPGREVPKHAKHARRARLPFRQNANQERRKVYGFTSPVTRPHLLAGIAVRRRCLYHAGGQPTAPDEAPRSPRQNPAPVPQPPAWTSPSRYAAYLTATGRALRIWDHSFTHKLAYVDALENLALCRRALVRSLIERFQEAGLLGPVQGTEVQGKVDLHGRVITRVVTSEAMPDVEMLAERVRGTHWELLIGVPRKALQTQTAKDVEAVVR